MPLFSPPEAHLPYATFPSSPHAAPSSSPPAFFFRRRTGKLDWSQLSSVSLQSIISTVNVSLLQQHVESLTYADISTADLSQATDGQIVHVIRLCQLTIEYLLNVQNYLLRLQRQRSRTYQSIAAEMERGRAVLQDRDAAILRLEQENRFLKKLNRHYSASAPPAALKQQLGMGGGGGGGGVEVLSVHQCEWCRASFVSELYLIGHMARRHPEVVAGGGRKGGKGKRKTAREEDEDEEEEAERARVRKLKEEEERVRKELAAQREELEQERRRLKQEKHSRRHHHQSASSASPSSPSSPSSSSQRRRSHHSSHRPAPIVVTPPTAAAQPAITKEWLDEYSRALERRVKEETLAAVKAAGEGEEIRRLQEKLDGIVRGDIPISPGTGSARADGEEDSRRRKREQELVQEIHSLKRQQQQQQHSPSSQSSSASRRQPPQSPSPQQSSAPPASFSPSSHSPPPMPEYSLRRFASFTEFPNLLSRFQHDEADLLASMRRFSQAADGMREEEAAQQQQLAARGYEAEVRGVEGEVERVMGEGWVDEGLERRWSELEKREKELDARRADREQRGRDKDRQQQGRERDGQMERERAGSLVQQQQLQQQPALQPQQQQQPPQLTRQYSNTLAVSSPQQPKQPQLSAPWMQPTPQVQMQPALMMQATAPVLAAPVAPQQFIPSAQPAPVDPSLGGIVGAASRGDEGLQLLLRRQHEQAGIVDELKRRMQPQQQPAPSQPSWGLQTIPDSEEKQADSLSLMQQDEETKQQLEEDVAVFSPQQSAGLRDIRNTRRGAVLPDARMQPAQPMPGVMAAAVKPKEEMSDEEEEEQEQQAQTAAAQRVEQPARLVKDDEVETIALDELQSPPAAALRPSVATPAAGGVKQLMPLRRAGGGLLMGAGAGSSSMMQRPTLGPLAGSVRSTDVAAAGTAASGGGFRPTAAAALARSNSAELELEEEEF